MTTTYLSDAALHFTRLGYAVFPCIPGGKTPITKHGCKDATTKETIIKAWWEQYPNANIGLATEGLLVIDVDGEGNAWAQDRSAELSIAPCSRTANGGRHYIYRQPLGQTWGNTCSRIAPRVDTRGNGGYIIAPPSIVDGKPYRWVEGKSLVVPAELPEPPTWLTDSLASRPSNWVAPHQPTSSPELIQRARAYIATMPPAISGSGGHNTTYTVAVALVHGFGLDDNEALGLLQEYNQRCLPAWSNRELQHKVKSARETEHSYPYRWLADPVSIGVDLTGILPSSNDRTRDHPADPGPIPERLLRVPGFVSEVMDYCLETAPYPNTVMAFCGALALQAFLAGRKVRDSSDNRTNLYLLGLAYSAAGKDWPRKINTRIAYEVGISDGIGERFASGEGIQDALNLSPCMLFQTDEIDGMLQTISKAKDARHENVMSTLLTMYSSANSVYPMRRKAGKESPGAIDQPHLVIFGTAIPKHYYEALSERMLTNGFFARMIILEGGPRSKGQDARILDLPPRVLAVAKWWADFHPGGGNLENWHPTPAVVECTDDARCVLREAREEAEAEYSKAEADGDSVGTTVWGRVAEQARKLALIYAVSETPEAPQIGKVAANWAAKFILHQTRRMLFMADCHGAETPFQSDCQKMIQHLRNTPGMVMSHSKLLKQMKVDSKSLREIVSTLIERGDVVAEQSPQTGHGGRPILIYRLT